MHDATELPHATALQQTDRLDWADMNGTDHFVQFYTDDGEIVEAVARYFVHGLRLGESCIMAATPEHSTAVITRMRALEPSIDAALADGRFVTLDARETLARFVVNGWPDEKLFDEVVGGIVRDLSTRRRQVRIFGEMVAMLAAEGNAEAAVELELLWNGLAATEPEPFRLFCAYSDRSLSSPGSSEHVHAIRSSHSQVIGATAPAV